MKLYFTDCIEEEVLYPDPELAQGCRFQKEVPSLKSCRNQTFAKINKNLCPTLDFFHRAAIVKWLSSSKQPKKKNANFMCQLHYWLFPCLGVVAVKMKGLEWVPSFIFSRFSVSNTWLNVLAVKMIGLEWVYSFRCSRLSVSNTCEQKLEQQIINKCLLFLRQ